MIVRQGSWTVCAVAKGKPRGTTRVESTQVRWFRVVRQGGEAELIASAKGYSRESLKLKGDHQAQVHSDQRVLMVVRQGGWTV